MGLFGSGKDDSAAGRARDAAERERARLEREARRAAREGRPVPEVPPLQELRGEPAPTEIRDVPPPAAPPVAPTEARDVPPVAPTEVHATPPVAPEPPRSAPTPPPAPQPPQAAPAAPEPTYEPAPSATAPTEVHRTPPAPEPPHPVADEPDFDWAEPTPAQPPAPTEVHRTPPPPPPSAEPPAPAFGDTHDFDAPVGVRRVARPDITGPPTVADPGPDAKKKGRRRGGSVPPARPGVPRRGRAGRRVAALMALGLLVAIGWFALSLTQPFAGDGEGEGSVKVEVPGGLSASEIGDLLAEKGVVDSGFFFSLRARLSGDRDKLRAGAFTLAEGMSYAAALDALTTAPPVAKTVTVTVPEGRSRRETLPIIRDSGLRGDYLKATRSSDGFSPQRLYGAPKGVRDLEGFLFPATYELRKNANVRALVDKQLAAFRENFAEIDLRAAKRKNLTAYDVLIIASMVEREAALDRERPLIAAVIYNRLQQGIPLGIDATIRFRLNQWTQPLKVSELNIDSDYNTRTRQGLPPGPIGNPGVKSLRAAAKPARSKALYYVVKPCGEGAHAFSDTDAEFQADVAAYNRARDARGGKDPSDC